MLNYGGFTIQNYKTVLLECQYKYFSEAFPLVHLSICVCVYGREHLCGSAAGSGLPLFVAGCEYIFKRFTPLPIKFNVYRQ